MITKITSFQTGDGKIHASIEDGQTHELKTFLSSVITFKDGKANLMDVLIPHKDKIIDILTMKASRKPKSRKVNGGAKKRSPKQLSGDALI